MFFGGEIQSTYGPYPESSSTLDALRLRLAFKPKLSATFYFRTEINILFKTAKMRRRCRQLFEMGKIEKNIRSQLKAKQKKLHG